MPLAVLLTSLAATPALAGPGVQWSAWSVDSCDADPAAAPRDARPQQADTDGLVALGLLRTSAGLDSDGDVACQNAALEVYSHEPVRLAVQCDEGVDVIVSYTLSPWSTLMTTPVLFDDGALLELPYRGDGPYHAARLTVSRTDGHLGTASCEVFLASQDAMLE